MGERRVHPRHEVRLPVKIKLGSYNDFTHQYATDISAGGLFIATDNPYEIGGEIDVEFYLEDNPKSFFKVRGEVTRLHDKPRGMGIQFTAIEESSQKMLDELLKRMGS